MIKKKRGKKGKSKPPVKHGKAGGDNKKATQPGVHCALALFHRRHVLISCQTGIQKKKNVHLLPLPQLENTLSILASNRCLLFVHHVSYVSHMSSKRKKKQGNGVEVACDKDTHSNAVLAETGISSWEFHWHGAVSRGKISAIGSVLKIIRKVVVECFDFFGTVGSCFVGSCNSSSSDSGCSVAPDDSQFGVSLGSACKDEILCDRSCI